MNARFVIGFTTDIFARQSTPGNRIGEFTIGSESSAFMPGNRIRLFTSAISARQSYRGIYDWQRIIIGIHARQ